MVKMLLPIFVLSILYGCAGSPMRIGSMSPEELRGVNQYNLCNAYHNNKDQEVRAELDRRNVLSKSEWSLIDSGYIQVGISELALTCLRGGIIPGVNGVVNTTTGSWGVHSQYVYENAFGSRSYVYVENGVVKSWQN